jgi:hypothetical protein
MAASECDQRCRLIDAENLVAGVGDRRVRLKQLQDGRRRASATREKPWSWMQARSSS